MKIIALLFTTNLFAQIHHQSFSHGNVATLSNGIVVSQSIGQHGVLGSYSNVNYVVQQGFQQSLLTSSILNGKVEFTQIVTKITPNPFISYINVEFSLPMRDKIEITIYDSTGKLFYKNTKFSIQNGLTIDGLDNLAEGVYLINLRSLGYLFSSKIIKQ